MNEASEVFTAALGTLAHANTQLSAHGVGLALGNKPLTIRLVGELVGVEPIRGRIELAVHPKGKSAS